MKKTSFSISLVFLMFIGCHNQLPPKEYANWIKDEANGLRVSKYVNGISLILQYEPPDFMAFREYKINLSEDKTFPEMREELEDYVHFVLYVQPDSSALNYQQKSQLSAYLAYKIQDDLTCISGNDTIKKALAHLESPVGVKPFFTIMLVFKAPEKNGDILVEYSGNFFKNPEPVIFRFREEYLEQTPQLTMNTKK
jgi:hypothetical protein